MVPESTDIDLLHEYLAIKQWASLNNMVINEPKTKMMVFHRPRPSTAPYPSPLVGIQRVFIAKLLGVSFNETLSFSPHIDFIVSQCKQRFFLLRSLRRSGLNAQALEAVFNAIILYIYLYFVKMTAARTNRQ